MLLLLLIYNKCITNVSHDKNNSHDKKAKNQQKQMMQNQH